MKPIKRIWAKTERRGPDECWLWTGGVGQKGAPTSSVGRRSMNPRRVVWEDAHGGEPLPRTRQVSNTCKVPRCLNPAHMFLKPFMDHEVRFWSYVNRNGPIVRPELGPCWEWTGGLFSSGCATFRMGRKQLRAARVAWEFTHGPITGHVPGHPELEVCVCHKCDNPKCVCPDHLFLGNDAINIADMWAKGRGSHGDSHRAAMQAGRLGLPRPLTKAQTRLLRATVAASPRGYRLRNAGHHQTARKLRELGLITNDIEPKATPVGIARLGLVTETPPAKEGP